MDVGVQVCPICGKEVLVAKRRLSSRSGGRGTPKQPVVLPLQPAEISPQKA